MLLETKNCEQIIIIQSKVTFYLVDDVYVFVCEFVFNIPMVYIQCIVNKKLPL